MSEIYRRISMRMWGDEDFRQLSRAQPNAQTLWQYLLTGPHTVATPGLFAATQEGLAASLKWPLEAFQKAFAELFPEACVKGLCKHRESPSEVCPKVWCEADWDAGVVWIQNGIIHNEPGNPNVLKGWKKTFDLIPECQLKNKAFQCYAAYAEVKGQAFAKAFREAFMKGFRKGLGKAARKGIASGSGSGSGTGYLRGRVGVEPPEILPPTEPANDQLGQPDDPPAVVPPLPPLPPDDEPWDLESTEPYAIATKELVRKRFRERHVKETGNPPGTSHRNDPDYEAIAFWVDEKNGDPERIVRTLLDGFFADKWVVEHGYPLAQLAKATAKYYAPPKVLRDVRKGYVEPAPESAFNNPDDLDAVFGPRKTSAE